MHFWTWRKQQQKLQANAKKYRESAENSAESLQDSLTPEIVSPNSNNSTNSNSNNLNLAPKRAYPTSNGTFKGQLISKCPFGVIVWTKIPTKMFPGFLP